MEDIIAAVLDIEHEAQGIINKARETANNIKAGAKDETEKMRIEYTERMNRRILKMQQKEDIYCSSKIRQLEEKCAAAEKSLDEKYEKNKEKWLDMLVSFVFGDLK